METISPTLQLATDRSKPVILGKSYFMLFHVPLRIVSDMYLVSCSRSITLDGEERVGFSAIVYL